MTKEGRDPNDERDFGLRVAPAGVSEVRSLRRQWLSLARESIGSALGFHIAVMAIAPIVIILMVLRLLVFYS